MVRWKKKILFHCFSFQGHCFSHCHDGHSLRKITDKYRLVPESGSADLGLTIKTLVGPRVAVRVVDQLHSVDHDRLWSLTGWWLWWDDMIVTFVMTNTWDNSGLRVWYSPSRRQKIRELCWSQSGEHGSPALKYLVTTRNTKYLWTNKIIWDEFSTGHQQSSEV